MRGSRIQNQMRGSWRMNISWCTLSLMGSFICKGLELISIIPSLIQLSLQIKVNQMLQSEISVPCQLLTSPGAQRARQTLMPCIYLRLPHCNLNFCTCPRIPGKSVCRGGGGALLESKSFIPVHLFCLVTAKVCFQRAKPARCLNLGFFWFCKERVLWATSHLLLSYAWVYAAGSGSPKRLCVFSFSRRYLGGVRFLPREYAPPPSMSPESSSLSCVFVTRWDSQL